jgi:hypothetical protein
MGGMGLSCCDGLMTADCQTEGPSGDGSVACGAPIFQCSICVRGCGDGQCTAGENRCNCPVDCSGGPRDAGPSCHQEGEVFAATPDILDAGPVLPPALQQTYCCGYNQGLFWVLSGAACDSPRTEVVCSSRCKNLQCEAGETPCTCPWDCATADAGCFSEGEEYSHLLHHGTCCPGLEPTSCDLLGSNGECGAPATDCNRCIRHCGDGVCTTGENRCNCPADCS